MNNNKRAIEEYFPIVDINRLAVPERNAFKPIYTMHKWFARRSSSVFRAILLGALKPAGTDIMKEFYKDHTNDPDTNGKVILDPFMGGGTTVVEALRLGCKVIGIDLNPVAWFIVKTEVEPVDLNELQKAFDRLAERNVSWSGKPLKETMLDLYKTECPSCGSKDVDIIYTFWVKSAPCTTATCNHSTPLFKDYIIAKKNPSIRYYEDCECPACGKQFDCEIEPAALVGDKQLMVNATQFSAGIGRASARWSYTAENADVECPWCDEKIKPVIRKKKKKRKKVPLNVLFCPNCEEVWQFRGELNKEVECPSCSHYYDATEGNIPAKGKFICRGTCNGNVDAIINAIRKLPEDKLLQIRPYAIEGYCEHCAGKENNSEKKKDVFFEVVEEPKVKYKAATPSLLTKNNGKFFKRFTAADLAKYNEAKDVWEKEKENLPYPKSEVPVGDKTKSGLIAHHYNYWHQMFNERQLLALSTLLKAIDEERDQVLKEMFLIAFSNSLNDNNMFCRFAQPRNHLVGVFARHDYQPKADPLEGNVFGSAYGHGGFSGYWKAVIKGKSYFNNSNSDNVSLEGISATNLKMTGELLDFVITDPPYAGNVNYSELADFFYVWLRLILKNQYPQFQPEYTPKVEEIIENKTRGISSEDFKEGLGKVFKECYRVSKETAPLIFTFHHAEDTAWEALLSAVCEAGYFIEAVYPIHGEAENSLHLMNNEAISYDLIHICRKRENGKENLKRSWAGVRREIRQRAREEIELIESGRYGKKLLPSDINILLIGKCLELYSKHYGAIVDYKDEPVPIREALQEIKMMVDQLTSKDHPLPPELEDIDRPSYIYFRTLCTHKEIKSDDVSKSVRGIIDLSVLRERGIIKKRRETRSRTFYVKQPLERLNELKSRFYNNEPENEPTLFGTGDSRLPSKFLIVDVIHLLLGAAETGENLLPWLERFGGLKPQIRAAMEYLIQKNKDFITPAKKVLGLIDERTLFTKEN